MRRRKFVVMAGGMVAIAGCAGESDAEAGDDEPVDDEDPDDDDAGDEPDEPDDENQDEPDPDDDDESDEDDDEGDSERGDADDEEDTIDDEAALSRIEVEAEAEGFNIDKVTIADDRSVGIEYYATEMPIEEEIEILTRIYLDLLEEGWDSSWLHGIEIDGEARDWNLEPEWVDQYLEGEMSFEEVISNAEETIIPS